MMASPSLRSCAGDMMACDESPNSGSFKLDEDGGGAPPMELYVGTLPVGGVVAGGEGGGTPPQMFRAPQYDGARAAAAGRRGRPENGGAPRAKPAKARGHTPVRGADRRP